MIAHKRISGKKDSEQAEVASPSLSSGDESWRTDNKKGELYDVKIAIFIYKCVTVSEYTVCCK